MQTSTDTARPADAAARPARPAKPQAVLEVISKTRLSPRLLRLTLGGPGYEVLHRNHHTDAYVKFLLADPASGLRPPYDMDTLRAEQPDLLPARRTYTVRHWDDAQQQIDVDVVLHGDGEDSGIAARWADEAQPGDRIAMMGAGGGYSPEATSRRHLLIGDHAALPAIAAALEAMDPAARGMALIHLEHEEDRLALAHPEGVELRWVLGTREDLVAAVQGLDLSDHEGLQVFCHVERGVTKRLRAVLVKEAGIPRTQISISAYWALGRIEDQFQAEKREPIGAIDD
ncbi:siderophore-interacting protein [Brachybacterium saurashtrense]|uniref:Siderophore-interacting protein n=1 Tax=Brachybacterium saurashtrense TaxID=556288 RepID=A0A345YMU8_9MICO|nr:siderophore-interacting protein [Brachybacterium saurashtrense]AXK45250.1 siderophore-interacting protein [Brachybacterium saurashtrense]RRR21995.1 siderophore-interacting protein [Brachybacterium saurashtrense]